MSIIQIFSPFCLNDSNSLLFCFNGPNIRSFSCQWSKLSSFFALIISDRSKEQHSLCDSLWSPSNPQRISLIPTNFVFGGNSAMVMSQQNFSVWTKNHKGEIFLGNPQRISFAGNSHLKVWTETNLFSQVKLLRHKMLHETYLQHFKLWNGSKQGTL